MSENCDEAVVRFDVDFPREESEEGRAAVSTSSHWARIMLGAVERSSTAERRV
jgi:hypothetical protein